MTSAGVRPAASCDTLVLLRTHRVDDGIMRIARALRDSLPYDFALLADETRGPLDARGLPKISLNPEVLDRLGLFRDLDAVGWQCGDYGCYVAQQEHPGKRFFWLIEPDVRIRFDSPGSFFRPYENAAGVDLLCAGLEPAPRTWNWRPSMESHADVVYRCLFPLVRLTSRALRHLLSRRQFLSAQRLEAGGRTVPRPGSWANDEAFVATEAMRAGLCCRDLNDFGRLVHTPETFAFWRVFAEAAHLNRPPDGLVYHPVLAGEALRNKVRSLVHDSPPGELAAVRRSVAMLAGAEFGQHEVRRYLDDLDRRARPGARAAAYVRAWLGRRFRA